MAVSIIGSYMQTISPFSFKIRHSKCYAFTYFIFFVVTVVYTKTQYNIFTITEVNTTKGLSPPEERLLSRTLLRPFDERTRRLLVAWDSWRIGMIFFRMLTGLNIHIDQPITPGNLRQLKNEIQSLVSVLLFK